MKRTSPGAKALAAARLKACRTWPYASHAILSMVPVERPGLGTLAVDNRWRVYYCPEFLASITPAEAASVVLHEVGHLLLKHHRRAKDLVPAADKAAWERWNLAADMAVNYLLDQESIKLPEGTVTHKKFDLPPALTAEGYYRLLSQQVEEGGESNDSGNSSSGSEQENQDNQGDSGPDSQGDENSSKPQPGQSGSCSDGQQRPWELGDEPEDQGQPDAEGQADQGQGDGQGQPGPASGQSQEPGEGQGQGEFTPGLDPHEQDQIVQQVAERVAKEKGTQAGHLKELVESILEPRIDPRRLLMRAVQAHTENLLSGGGGRFTYRRPSRRPGQGGLIRPRSFRPVPRILVIIDTSGSMGRQELALAVGLVGRVLSGLNLRDGVRVVTADAAIQGDMRVLDPRKIELSGRGGTDFSAMLRHAVEMPMRERPELCVICTDGIDHWPAERPPFPVVACMTSDPGPNWPVAAWADRVNIYH